MLIHKLSICLGLILLGVGSWSRAFPALHSTPVPPSPHTVARVATAHRPRVNAPYNVPGQEAAIFWFGRVTPDDNYADVRVGYREERMFVHLNIIDRRLWYDPAPSPATLTDWDAVSLYLDVPAEPGAVSTRYRFDAQLSWGADGEDRGRYVAAYRYTAGDWVSIATPFTTTVGWNGSAPNNEHDDRGWNLLYRVPYAPIGLDGPPARGTVWGMALVLYDRDSAAGPPLPPQTWPPAMSPTDPSTWGELVFGAPLPYTPLPAVPGGVLTIRHGLDDAVVVDADVGGSSVCGAAAAPDYFPTWGELNYAGKTFLNVQNLGYISEWPCFSKYYVTFPLDALPPGKVILSAYLTLYQFGNAGEGETPGPKPSLIQVSVIDQAWDEASITWNNAPLPVENVTAAWVDPLETSPPWPGIPKEWDVSSAVAAAYTSGCPVRLALYSPDWDFHSGKYFYSSDIAGNGEGRPTLTIHWGESAAQLEKEADKGGANYGDTIEYVLRFYATGGSTVITDRLPAEVAWMDDVGLYGTAIEPVYDPVQHRLTWEDNPAPGGQVRLTYTVTVATFDRQLVINVAELLDGAGATSSATAFVIANPYRCYLPLVLRR